MLIIMTMTLSACGDLSQQGYDDGLKGEKNGFQYAINKTYQQAYDEATDDRWLNDAGCNDARMGKIPNREEPEYIVGYKRCKRKVTALTAGT